MMSQLNSEYQQVLGLQPSPPPRYPSLSPFETSQYSVFDWSDEQSHIMDTYPKELS